MSIFEGFVARCSDSPRQQDAATASWNRFTSTILAKEGCSSTIELSQKTDAAYFRPVTRLRYHGGLRLRRRAARKMDGILSSRMYRGGVKGSCWGRPFSRCILCIARQDRGEKPTRSIICDQELRDPGSHVHPSSATARTKGNDP